MDKRMKSVALGPRRVTPSGIGSKRGKGGESDFLFYDRPDDERSDADRKLAEPDRRILRRDDEVGRRKDSNAAADRFSLDARNDELRAPDHRDDEIGKTEEELLSGGCIRDGFQLGERSACTEGSIPFAAQHYHADRRVGAHFVKRVGELREQRSGQRVTLGMRKGDRTDTALAVRVHFSLLAHRLKVLIVV